MKSKDSRSIVVVARSPGATVTDPIQRAANQKGHGPQTAGSGFGGMIGGMVGSFAGPGGALLGAAVGAAIGYALCD